jgi:hypothetical protein
MSSERERRFVGPRRGQIVFAVFFFAASALLLALIGDQTRWVPKTQLAAQPRFWPGVGLGLMTVCGGLYLYRLPWKRPARADWAELRRWGAVLEYALWFMAYVLAVPILGYLPTTLVFVPLLSWRMGYRRPRMLVIAALFGVCVVVLFKSFLSVRIPGGMVYEYLPGALRSFFILNL